MDLDNVYSIVESRCNITMGVMLRQRNITPTKHYIKYSIKVILQLKNKHTKSLKECCIITVGNITLVRTKKIRSRNFTIV